MDRADAALDNRDLAGLVSFYADDAVVTTPDQGDLVGASAVRAYLDEFLTAFPDVRYEYGHRLESGNVAIDEGFIVGTHTGPLTLATGEIQEPTGRRIRVRTCDVAEVSGDRIVRHRFYFDQMDFLSQLDLLPVQQDAAQSMRDDTV